jgi:hypothetical protein
MINMNVNLDEELRRFIKEEFEYTSFMIDLGKTVPRDKLFDMFLRTDKAKVLP